MLYVICIYRDLRKTLRLQILQRNDSNYMRVLVNFISKFTIAHLRHIAHKLIGTLLDVNVDLS